MDSRADAPHNDPDAAPRKRLSRRTAVVGSLIVILALAGTGWLTWRLTHPTPAPGATAGAAGPAGAGGRRGAPSTTVGVATAERSSIPVFLEALGTVTPQAIVKVRPQVSGVME